MNNDELIAAGHELAKCLDSNTPLLDIAKMIVRLADKLDVTTLALREKTKQCEQLAAEVYDVKHPGTYLPSKCETPATDSFLCEVRAQGVEMFAQWCRGERDFTLIDGDIADAEAYEECLKRVEYFATQLRQGGAA
ncbi:hypothetical protein ACMSYW_000889 [Cronobacter dublinensis]